MQWGEIWGGPMPTSMLLIWAGALLVVAGVLFTAAHALWRGRLSEARRPRPEAARDSLEPHERGGLGLMAGWPSLVLVALGSALLLAGAVIRA